MNAQKHCLTIERLRYTNPTLSLNLAIEFLDDATGIYVPKGMAEWGSSLRAVGRLLEAREVLRLALDEVDVDRRWRETRASLLRRIAEVEIAAGNFDLAVEIADKAIILANSVAALREIGLSFLTKGHGCHNLCKYEAAAEFSQSGLAYLKDPYDKFGALVNLAHHWQGLGEKSHRDEALRAALGQPVCKAMLDRAQWVYAEVDLEEGQSGRAAKTFGLLVESFVKRDEIADAALSACLQVDALRQSGQTARAREVAAQMTKFVLPLASESTFVEAALVKLVVKARGVCEVDAHAIAGAIKSLRSLIQNRRATLLRR